MTTISREEKLQKLKEEFKKMDTNGDGLIEAQELIYHLDMKNVSSKGRKTIRSNYSFSVNIFSRKIAKSNDFKR